MLDMRLKAIPSIFSQEYYEENSEFGEWYQSLPTNLLQNLFASVSVCNLLDINNMT